MYINPFERMKNQKEAENKKEKEKEKEKEKYMRLGAQMGFVENKAIMPSFIKTMIDDSNKVSVPPFPSINMSLDNSIDNQKVEQIKQRHYSNDQRLKPSENLVKNNESINFPPFSQNNSISENLKEKENNSIREYNNDFLNINSKNQNINSVTETMGTIKPFYQNDINDTKLQETKKKEVSENKIIEDSYNILDINKYKESFNKTDLANKLIMITVDKPESIKIVRFIKEDLNSSYKVFIDISEISKYKRPYRFFLKQFISKLPIQIDIEDRRELWERVDLMFKGTSWGKVNIDDDIEEILDDVFIVNDPIDLICSEFANLFEAYNFNGIISIFVENLIPVEGTLKKSFIEFFNKIITRIPNLNLTFVLDKEFYNEFYNEYIFNYVDVLVKFSDKPVIKKKDTTDLPVEPLQCSSTVINKDITNNYKDNSNISSQIPSYSNNNENFNSFNQSNLNNLINHDNNHIYPNSNYTNQNNFEEEISYTQPNKADLRNDLLNSKKMRIEVSRVLEKRQSEIDKINKIEEKTAREKMEGPIFRTEILANNNQTNKNNETDEEFNLWKHQNDFNNVSQINIEDKLQIEREQSRGNNLFSIDGSNWNNINRR
ncbi:hypothetical protein SCORR_v1c09590 [Spiroplasma corruscae]|uniref:Uncharacterized protein n=1 Tax=Spiroplasma corruscae TaxID=216934 RepID=A0A222EQR2_9MOLU|nr:hypothetical protein [Spiroplasma corruscae]ASP28731.1 hypothetical protein SCORR_v1c09590 [Spiroplasma corruscae]